MKLDARQLVAPLVATLVLVLTLRQTVSAVKSWGAWQPRPRSQARAEDPYAFLDRELGRTQTAPPVANLRDPFDFGAGRVVAVRTVRTTTPPSPPPAPRPVLTSIVWDNDPRATIRYDGRDFSVRENSLFADFRVASITSNQVVLERAGSPVVLTLRPKGD